MITADTATGAITTTVSATGVSAPSRDGLSRHVNVWLNTDQNDSTGSPSGNEYGLRWVDDPSDPPPWWDIQRWDGSEAVQPDGRIIAAGASAYEEEDGAAGNRSPSGFTIVRYLPTGKIDVSFGATH